MLTSNFISNSKNRKTKIFNFNNRLAQKYHGDLPLRKFYSSEIHPKTSSSYGKHDLLDLYDLHSNSGIRV